MLAHILQQAGKHVGLVSTLGARVDGKVIAKGDLAGPLGFDMVARNPNVDAIVAEVARGALIRRGIGVKTSDVGAVTNVTTDQLGAMGDGRLDDMAEDKAEHAENHTRTKL